MITLLSQSTSRLMANSRKLLVTQINLKIHLSRQNSPIAVTVNQGSLPLRITAIKSTRVHDADWWPILVKRHLCRAVETRKEQTKTCMALGEKAQITNVRGRWVRLPTLMRSWNLLQHPSRGHCWLSSHRKAALCFPPRSPYPRLLETKKAVETLCTRPKSTMKSEYRRSRSHQTCVLRPAASKNSKRTSTSRSSFIAQLSQTWALFVGHPDLQLKSEPRAEAVRLWVAVRTTC